MKHYEKRQVWTFLVVSSMLSLAFSGTEVLYTTYAVNELQVDASSWSQARSLRFMLTMAVVFLLGTFASRIGTKTAATFAVVLSAASLGLTVAFEGEAPALYLLYPLYGALTQILLVNLNVMAQESPPDARETVNTLYRSSFIALSMLGPAAATFWVAKSYAAAFLFFGFVLAGCVFVLRLYPGGKRSERAAGGSKAEWRRVLSQWAQLCRNRSVLIYVLVTGLINQTFMVNVTLLPVKLMNEMGMSEQRYGLAVMLQSATGFVLVLATGFLLKRHLTSMIIAPYLLSAVGNLAMGTIHHPVALMVAFVLSNAVYQATMAPTSLWLSRQVPSEQLNTVFSFAKICSAMLGAVVTAVLVLLQPVAGINLSLSLYGIVGFLCTVAIIPLLHRGMRDAERRTEEE